MPALIDHDQKKEAAKDVSSTEALRRAAHDASRQLASFLASNDEPLVRVQIAPEADADTTMLLPTAAIQKLHEILLEIARGNSVTVIPMSSELTTQQAADVLDVSRPFLIERLEQGEIPYRKVGTHRRVRLSDLMAYKQTMDRNRLNALEELSAQAQELGMGY